MKVTTEELERRQVLVTVELDSKKEQDLLEKAAKRIAKEVRIPGFRPGKAPYNVIVRRFGLEAIQQEALENAADNLIRKALEEADVKPFAKMDLESVEWDPLTLKVKVPIEPKINLEDYHAIRLDFEPIEVTEDDIEEALEELQEQNATWTPVERASQLSDRVTISVLEKDEDTVLAERESLEYELTFPDEDLDEDEDETALDEAEESEDIEDTDDTGEDEAAEAPKKPSTPFRPDLTTPLLNLKTGDEKAFIIPYPEDFGDKRYAGKDITFEVKLLEVSEKQLAPIDDDFAKLVSDFDTLDQLREDIEQNILRQREAQQNQELGNEVLKKILEGAEIEWPQAFEEETIESEIAHYERQLNQYGLNLENYLSLEIRSRDDFLEERRGQVVERLKRSLVLGEVAEREHLQITESDILARAKLLADLSGRGEQFWRQIISAQVQQSLIANDLLVEKVVNFLAAIAKGEEPASQTDTDESAVSTEVVSPGVAIETSLEAAEPDLGDERAGETLAPASAEAEPASVDDQADQSGEPAAAEAQN